VEKLNAMFTFFLRIGFINAADIKTKYSLTPLGDLEWRLPSSHQSLACALWRCRYAIEFNRNFLTVSSDIQRWPNVDSCSNANIRSFVRND
jgi:hypothetical protein